MKKIDLTGKRYGHLTVLKENGKKGKNVLWLCCCDCGNKINVIAYNLKNGHTQSCGCMRGKNRITHNKSKSRLYRIWRHIKSRCLNKRVSHYKYYGGRGISLCEEWKNSFEKFYEWANLNGYQENLSIDRIDVNGNYEPSNCRWTNAKAQANNKTNNRLIEYNGKIHTLSEWSDILGINHLTLSKRIDDYGWNIKRAFETPIRDRISEETIFCACGCGTIIKRYSKYGRERKYVIGHNNRKQQKKIIFDPLVKPLRPSLTR